MSDCVIRSVAAIDCRYEPRPWPFATENQIAIEAHWQELIAAKPALFNGQVLLMHRWAIEGEVFRSGYFPTDYASFMAFRDFGFPDSTKRNGFAMAALQASDGAFLLGEMGRQTANAGAVYFASGTPDMKDVVGDRVDLARSVTRELVEETGLDPASLAIDPDWTVVMETGRVALMRRMRSPLDSSTLAQRIETFLSSESEPELARIHVVRGVADMAGLAMPSFQEAYLSWAFAAQR